MKPRIFLVAAAALVSLLYLPACQTSRPKPSPAVTTKDSPAVAAYRQAMEDRLGPIWYQLVRIHEDELSVGTVSTTFEIPAAGGKPRHVKVVSNTGSVINASIALRAIDQFRASPIPPQALAELHQGYIEFEESFAVLPSR